MDGHFYLNFSCLHFVKREHIEKPFLGRDVLVRASGRNALLYPYNAFFLRKRRKCLPAFLYRHVCRNIKGDLGVGILCAISSKASSSGNRPPFRGRFFYVLPGHHFCRIWPERPCLVNQEALYLLLKKMKERPGWQKGRVTQQRLSTKLNHRIATDGGRK